MIILYVVLALVIGFSLGYYLCSRRVPGMLGRMNSEDLKVLASRVSKERK